MPGRLLTWSDIIARLDADPDMTPERRQAVLDDYRAEAIEMSGIALNAATGESMRAHGQALPPGPTPEQRRRKPRELPGKARHGTSYGYCCGCRCKPCTVAKTASNRLSRQRRLDRERAEAQPVVDETPVLDLFKLIRERPYRCRPRCKCVACTGTEDFEWRIRRLA